MRLICIIFLIMTILSCAEEKIEHITDPKDYNHYLKTEHRETYENASHEISFWSKRLKTDSSGIGDLGPLANAYTSLYEASAEIEHLKNAERLYLKASKLPSLNKDAHIRSLAYNYISQHRFKKAVEILERSYKEVSNKHATELMLFDVYFEVGEYEKAYHLLNKFENDNDYNYLIRKAKWNDYKGNSETVLRSMEKARMNIEARGNQQLRTWVYSNLAVYYGHYGYIKESYNYFLKTLEIQPDHSMAKRGIAWIVYSYEKKPDEANRILDSIMKNYNDPAYLLFKAELAEFDNDKSNSNLYKQKFIKKVESEDYGSMYNIELIKLYAETDPKKAIELATFELENRSTALVYCLLAYAHLMNGDSKTALATINEHVKDLAIEPMALYYAGIIFHSIGNKELLSEVVELLEESSFEIGPLKSSTLNN